MVISTYFNSDSKTLFLSTSLDNDEITIKKEDGVTLIYNKKEELVAVNIFDYNLEQDSGIVKNEEVLEEIKKYFDCEIENPFIVGKVLEIKKHPKSEKLNICKVDLGNKEEQIVCGAKNVEENIKVIVSQVGAVMPNGMKIKESKLIDEISNGMITSLYELGYSDDNSKGIEILDDSYEVGSAYEHKKA